MSAIQGASERILVVIAVRLPALDRWPVIPSRAGRPGRCDRWGRWGGGAVRAGPGDRPRDKSTHSREPAGSPGHLDERHVDAARTSRRVRRKEFFTEKEAAEYEKQVRERNDADRRDSNAEADLAVGYNAAWWDRERTSSRPGEPRSLSIRATEECLR